MRDYIIALDQGTTSSRAIVFDKQGAIVSQGQYPLPQHYPQPGWVEHDPMDILRTQLMALASAWEKAGLSPGQVAAIGVTNQRETAIVWEKATGKPVMNAIVWQCRRTAEECERLEKAGIGDYIRQKTGLLIDAYFTGTKISWILDHVPGARARAENGELLCGTVDSWLIWNLTGEHVSDYSNCSRTMLFDIESFAGTKNCAVPCGCPCACCPDRFPTAKFTVTSVRVSVALRPWRASRWQVPPATSRPPSSGSAVLPPVRPKILTAPAASP